MSLLIATNISSNENMSLDLKPTILYALISCLIPTLSDNSDANKAITLKIIVTNLEKVSEKNIRYSIRESIYRVRYLKPLHRREYLIICTTIL